MRKLLAKYDVKDGKIFVLWKARDPQKRPSDQQPSALVREREASWALCRLNRARIQ